MPAENLLATSGTWCRPLLVMYVNDFESGAHGLYTYSSKNRTQKPITNYTHVLYTDDDNHTCAYCEKKTTYVFMKYGVG